MQSWGRQREVERPKQQLLDSRAHLGDGDGARAEVAPSRQRDDRLSLVIDKTGGDVNVWIGLPEHDPTTQNDYGFIIGHGATTDEALADAVKALEEATERLQGPPGTVEERE